ncbi:MAG: ATP-binding protein [Acidimicrobiia bacterium]
MERSLRVPLPGTRQVAVPLAWVLGLVVLVALAGLLGVARASQIAVTLLVPAGVVGWFWRQARDRIADVERSRLGGGEDVDRVMAKARAELLAGIAHELVLHPERCSLRAETLAVAVDYRFARPELKVAVPDVVMVTDPHLFRYLLHSLVANAVAHGGSRIAIWAETEESSVWIAVSDDGPGVPADLEPRLMERTVDLVGTSDPAMPGSSGLSIARTIGEVLGGQLAYRRDARWTHFSLRLPLGVETGRQPAPSHRPMEAGVS